MSRIKNILITKLKLSRNSLIGREICNISFDQLIEKRLRTKHIWSGFHHQRGSYFEIEGTEC